MKRGFIILGCILFLLMFGIGKTFGLFESNKDFTSSMNIAKFNLLVNNDNIIDKKTFTINSITIQENKNVLEGKIAPGVCGYFTLELSGNSSDVDILYNISIDTEEIANENIILENVTCNDEDIIKTDKNTYTGIFRLSEIKNNTKKNIKIYFKWENNDENNEIDSSFANGVVSDIPISILASQYLGEEIIPYNEEIDEDI